jgi:hypothetical protein
VKSYHKPAPSTTLETPLHNVRKPSTLDMVSMALLMPVYTAVGDGLTICMRVCRAMNQHMLSKPITRPITYLHQVNRIHDRVFLHVLHQSITFQVAFLVGASYRNASKRSGGHVRRQREVRWKALIAALC